MPEGTSLTINGAKVNVQGGENCAGIGGGGYSAGGSPYENAGKGPAGGKITINGGTVFATGGGVRSSGFRGGAGIGGGHFGAGGTVVINNGMVTATGGEHSAGIGNGSYDFYDKDGDKGTVTIYGGTITATGGLGAVGIGGAISSDNGWVIIHGGNVTAQGAEGGAGIGNGMNGRYVNITIYGGTIDAIGGSDASAIGGTRTAYNDYSQIEIHGGAITAKASSRARGAIAGTSVLLDGGVITAQGTGCPGVSSGVNGAGIYIKNDVVVFASGSCGIDGYQEQPGWNGLVFENGAGRVYGTVAPPKDFEIPDGYTIDLPEGSELTLPANTSLPSNITLTGSGTLYPEEKRSIPQVSIEHNW